MSAVNETLIRDVVSEVLGRLNGAVAPAKNSTPAAAPKADCGCSDKRVNIATGGSISAGAGKFGVFSDANEACAAAHEGFLQLRQKGMAARAKVVEIIKTMAEANAAEWGRIEIEETKIGRLDHKIAKLQIIKLVPGV